MSRRKKALIVTALFLAGLVAAIFFATPRQPQYQGRSLSEWLADLSSQHYETQRVARAAIQAMGPEAVPFLTNSLAQRDSISLRAYRRNLIPRRLATWSHRFVKWQTPVMESRSAALALQSLGPQATNAIPGLVAALQDPSWAITQAAVGALGTMGSNAVPALGERLTNGTQGELPWVLQAVAALGTNAAPLAPKLAELTTAPLAPNARANADAAANALARIGAEAIPTITNALQTTNVATQLRLLNSLRSMGSPALLATNVLVELMHNTNATVRLNARNVFGAMYPPAEMATPLWVEGLRDPDAANVEASLRFLTIYPANVLAHNREIAELAKHPTNSIAMLASNALTRFRAWPQ